MLNQSSSSLSNLSDLKVDTPDEDTRERSSSGEPIRERGSTITKKIPLSEYATLQVNGGLVSSAHHNLMMVYLY